MSPTRRTTRRARANGGRRDPRRPGACGARYEGLVTQLQRLSRRTRGAPLWAPSPQGYNDARRRKSCAARAISSAACLVCVFDERWSGAKKLTRQQLERMLAASQPATLAAARKAEELQRRSGDVGRTPLAEHESLLKQLAEAGLQRHRVQGKLASCSQELERTTASHTMMLELWATDAEALRSRMLQSHSRHDAEMSTTQVAAAAAGEAQSGEILAERARGADVLGATCAALRAELCGRTGTSPRGRRAALAHLVVVLASRGGGARVGRMVARGIAHGQGGALRAGHQGAGTRAAARSLHPSAGAPDGMQSAPTPLPPPSRASPRPPSFRSQATLQAEAAQLRVENMEARVQLRKVQADPRTRTRRPLR